ncbi:MAG: NAD(P)-dependent oxidoreductase [Candidatus Aenigmarchaeota archaeon]|nr:NAD(P)-dependent oxidoreductase [Candidatus Aenigmarchaeota archaeon]
MKVLVTGSSGYLGAPTCAALQQKHIVRPYDLRDGKDIFDAASLARALQGMDAVVHLAAIPRPLPDRSFADYFQVNCVGTHQVVQAAVAKKVKRLVFASSTAYYGIETGIPVQFPVREDQRTVPMYLKAEDLTCTDGHIAYSESKVIAENILAFYGLRKKIEIVILRFSAIGKVYQETSVSLENAVQGIVKALESPKRLWYEAFNVVDDIARVNNEKAKKVLGYRPGPAVEGPVV